MTDLYVYRCCVDGSCPLLVEEQLYGLQVSTCKEYCGNSSYDTCENCFFFDSDKCEECEHRKEMKP